MVKNKIILNEQCGTLGPLKIYKENEKNEIVQEQYQETVPHTICNVVGAFFREILLPHGYPDSVSPDYAEYQTWDTIQAFCSTVTGVFTTQAVLTSVGVGSTKSSALAATITWVLRDGTGLLGRLAFAWWRGQHLDGDCKKWRLCADFLNDAAMVIELCAAHLEFGIIGALCAANCMKAAVGVAGAATRTAIVHHQAIDNNMAEVAAKDGSQETVVNLLASITGIFILTHLESHHRLQWVFLAILIILHLFANYKAVTSLIFHHVNDARMALICRKYIFSNDLLRPKLINQQESVILGFHPSVKDFCGFSIKVGGSIRHLIHSFSSDEMMDFADFYKDKPYFIIPNCKTNTIHILLEKNINSQHIIKAYYHAIFIALTINNSKQKVGSCRKQYLNNDADSNSPLGRLKLLISYHLNVFEEKPYLSKNALKALDPFIGQELNQFFIALQTNGWKIDSHALLIDQWRANWKITDSEKRKKIQ